MVTCCDQTSSCTVLCKFFKKIVMLCEWLQRTTQHGIHESWHITGIRTMTWCIRSRRIPVIFVHPTRKYCFFLVPTGGCSLIYIRSVCYLLPSEGLMNHSFKSKDHHWPDWWCGQRFVSADLTSYGQKCHNLQCLDFFF